MRHVVLLFLVLISTDTCAQVNAAVTTTAVSSATTRTTSENTVARVASAIKFLSQSGAFYSPEKGEVCVEKPDVSFGEVKTTAGNFPHMLILKDSITCDSGYSVNRDTYETVCRCTVKGGKCAALNRACVPTLSDFNEAPWLFLTVRGDPRMASGIMSLSSLIFLVQLLSWLFLGMYIGLLILNPYHPKASFVGSKAVLWYYMYAGLVASFGSDESGCGKRRKYFNFALANAIGVVLSVVDLILKIKTDNEQKLSGAKDPLKLPPIDASAMLKNIRDVDLSVLTRLRFLGLPAISLMFIASFAILTVLTLYLVTESPPCNVVYP
eukprot:c8100_g1_i1.p1 GENE.c8100_g1_i1~~c8100_g1_i1.p1  ORF type:complete len:324 (-),score=70.67 c8100_g1_i1:49-1020(-)